MKKLRLRQQALIHSFFAFLYIVLVVVLMNNGEKIFASDNSFLIPIGMLLLLVLSVSIMGILIFGKPVLMFLNGEKKEAVKLLIYTIISLFIIAVLYFGILFFIK